MKKDLAVIFGLLLLIVFLMVFARGYTSSVFFPQSTATRSAAPKGFAQVTVRDLTVDAKVVGKAADRSKGLSDTDSMPLSQGMLFVFEQSGNYPFWMKDMKFAIDIIWISEDKKVVYIAQNAYPEPEKDDDELTLYRPGVGAKYVLEINAGLSSLHGITIGDSVNFEI